MRLSAISLIALIILSNLSVEAVQAQQRRSILIHFRKPDATKLQWAPNSDESLASSAGQAQPDLTMTAGPAKLFSFTESTATPLNEQSADSQDSRETSPDRSLHGDMSNRPTLQQMQNASGQYQMTHQGFTTGQYQTGNQYLGNQFNNWNNLRSQPVGLDSFESANRFQPPTYSGAYFSPNTYFGSGFGQWNNLSQGSIVENPIGGWSYR